MSLSELAFLQAIAWSLPPVARMVEVGSWKGRSTVALCEALAENPGAQLAVVDTFAGDPAIAAEIETTGVEEEFRVNTSDFSSFLEIIVADSVAGAAHFDNRSLDCVFIDANHEYAYVLADIRAWAPKVKLGGLLCGHDYGKFGLNLAVHRSFGPVSHWESIWFTRRRLGRHPRYASEAIARRAFGRL